ncbi:hypothetical protein ACFLTU_09630 [Bacteroidota bacterium]
MKRKITVLVLCLFLTSFLVPAQDGNTVNQEEILSAVKDGTKYITKVLLDENGKSRCEYNMLTGEWQDYEPAWHTGQLIYALTESYRLEKDPATLAAAVKAGDWWTGLQIRDNSKLDGMLRAIHLAGVEYIVFATVSDGTAGLFKLYELTGEKSYADVPTEAGSWMLANMYDEKNGLCYDLADPVTGEIIKDNSPFWPDKQNQTLFDVARPNTEGSLFLDIYNYSGKKEFLDAFINLCNSLVDKQGPEGLWMDFTPNDKEDGSFHPRYNLWNAESLLDCYEFTKDRKYLEAAISTAKQYAKIQKKDGTIYYRNYIDGKPEDRGSICGSAVSFAGIVWLRLIELGEGDEFLKNVQLSARWVVNNRFPIDHPDPNLAGAFLNSRTRVKNANARFVNRDVGTAFGIRFLAKYNDYVYGE